jgi:hypothetical protein
MIECRYCGEVVFSDPERTGARCRRCREPLYERREMPRPPEGTQPVGQCVLHPGHPAIGTCERCGTYLCGLCRTRWQDRALCLGCVERGMQSKETRPEDVQAHRRGAMLGVVFGVIAWALMLVAFILMLTARASSGETVVRIAGLLALASFLPAVFGAGQAAAAIRVRGNRLILATCGLALSAGHLGIVLGMLVLSYVPR